MDPYVLTLAFALGRIHAHTVVTVYVAETAMTIETGDGDTRTGARTTTQPVRNIRPLRPRKAAPSNLGSPSSIT